MDELMGLIDRFGLVAGLLAITALNYILIRRSASKSEDAAKNAATAQQQAITAQFTTLAEDNRRLQARVDALEAAADEARAASMVMAAELNEAKREAVAQQKALIAAQEKAAQLEGSVKTLTDKVLALESEKVQRAGELERERVQGQALTRSLNSANAQIAQLKDRVSRLEGENAALKLMLEKLKVVEVKTDPDPDPDPDPPPLKVAAKPEVASEDKAA